MDALKGSQRHFRNGVAFFFGQTKPRSVADSGFLGEKPPSSEITLVFLNKCKGI